MGGNENENGRNGVNQTPKHLDDSLGKVPSTSKVKGHIDFNRQTHDFRNVSYFSTLEVPQSFSFEQKFRRSNALILSDVQSSTHDRSLSSSPVNGRYQLESSSETNRVSDSRTSIQFHPGQSGDMPRSPSGSRQERTGREGSSSLPSSRSESSLRRQKYLEKRRHSSPCWPMQVKKRSSHSDDEDEGISLQPVRKIFVNEERMAARFDGLSLSHLSHQPPSLLDSRHADVRSIMEDIDSRLMDSDDEEEDEVLSQPRHSGGQRLQISDHLKTAFKQSPTEVLPDRIAKKIANPCTAMILWNPPDVPTADRVCPSRDSEASRESDVMGEEDEEVAVNIERPMFGPSLDGRDEHMEL